MRILLHSVLLLMLGGLAGYAVAGTRTESGLASFQVCLTGDAGGSIDRAIVRGEILLDNGGVSRPFGYNIYPLLTPAQKTALQADFKALLRFVSIREDVPTPVPTSTP